MEKIGKKCHVLVDGFDSGQYRRFLDFAFGHSTAWGVSKMNFYHEKDLDGSYLGFFDQMEEYRVDSAFYDFPQHYTKGQGFAIYEMNEPSRKFIKSVGDIFDWTPPSLPEDLTFYHDKKWWFSAISHEREMNVRPYCEAVLNFFEANGLTLSDRW